MYFGLQVPNWRRRLEHVTIWVPAPIGYNMMQVMPAASIWPNNVVAGPVRHSGLPYATKTYLLLQGPYEFYILGCLRRGYESSESSGFW